MSKLVQDVFDDRIHNRIDQVITFGEVSRLEAEVKEYWVTESLEAEYDKLLDLVDEAMKGGGGFDCCVWLSGFYGSGKSSFGKYLGFSLDPTRMVDGKPFREVFTNQFEKASLRQRFKTVAANHEATVIMLDLSNEGRAKGGMTQLNNLVFDRVADWAGYAKEAKVAQLEFLLEKEGKYEDFKKRAEEEKGRPWATTQKNPMLAKSVASKLAPEFFPDVWESSADFNEITIESTETLRNQVEDMLDLIERRTGSRKVIFVIDELGHHLRDNPSLINPCDGFARAIKELGGGQAWVIATAQQTLGKDGPFFPLRARFPVDVDLKPSDIREITYRRLLKKSDAGKKELEGWFEKKSQSLRHNTKLVDAKLIQADDISKEDFVNFYPLLPHLFDLIIHLLGSMAKTTGGVGLRPALKFTQDMLITQDGVRDKRTLASEALGSLVTVVDIYDNLAKDLERIAPEIVNIVNKVISTHGADSWPAKVAKSIALLQQLDGFPTTPENLAALLYPSLDSEPVTEEVVAAIEVLRADSFVPIGAVEGKLRFLSETVSRIRSERDKISPKINERDRIRNTQLEELFPQRPAYMLQGTRKVEAGVGLLMSDGRGSMLVGDKAEIQYLIKFVTPSQLESEKKMLNIDSATSANENRAYVLASIDSAVDDLAVEIYRCQEIVRRNRTDADKEVRDYVKSEGDQAIQLGIRLKEKLQQSIQDGWFIFRGQPEAISSLGNTPADAFRKRLEKVADAVFDKYHEAAGRVEGGTAEALLLTKDLSQVASKNDPLELVKKSSPAGINNGKACLVSILEYLDKHGQVEGKRLLDTFNGAPYGWSKDTTRYLVAALLIDSKVKIKLGGAVTTVPGETGVAALKSIPAFSKTTVSPNLDEPDPAHLIMSAQRLVELTGESVMPLTKNVSEAVMRHFPKLQQEYAGLNARLNALDLPGADRAASIIEKLEHSMVGDASSAPSDLGTESSALYEDLIWARDVKQALNNGAEQTIKEFRKLDESIVGLPSTGACETLQLGTEALRNDLSSRLSGGEFHRHIIDLNSGVSELQNASNTAASEFLADQAEQLENQKQELLQKSGLKSIQDDSMRNSLTDQVESLSLGTDTDLNAARELPSRMMEVNSRILSIERVIRECIEEQNKESVEEPTPTAEQIDISLPVEIRTTEELDQTIESLEAVRPEIESGKVIRFK